MRCFTKVLSVGFCLLLVGGCTVRDSAAPDVSKIVEVILNAAESPQGTHADVEFVIAGVGEGRGMSAGVWYLNSEVDYRDFRSLNLTLDPWVVQQLKERNGIEGVDELLGRSVRVQGQAFRVPIFFFCEGRQTEAYYFQTQLPVQRMSQIELL